MSDVDSVDYEGSSAYIRAGGKWVISVPPSQFDCNLKKKSFKKLSVLTDTPIHNSKNSN